MAASPRGEVDLDYEAEETAIIRALGGKLDLLVEESGNPGQLGERFADLPAMQVLHLSCHGHNEWRPNATASPRPILALEDDNGDFLPTEAANLIEALSAQPPRFVFLSACLTASAGKSASTNSSGTAVADSLAESIVDAGLPAVLGWDGSVFDIAAIDFAAILYDSLSARKNLADAVGSARRTLLNAPEARGSDHWHLARLWLGPAGGGPIVGGRTKRAMMPATYGEKEFFNQNRLLPVASHEMFVGRRRELQAALRALRDDEHAGVLLHGMGRLGKSSLAARIANRRRDLKLAVVFAHYGALDIMNALGEALRQPREASDAVHEATKRVSDDPNRLEQEVTWLLSGPCAQAGVGGAPVLLVIDDLERILEWDAGRGHHVVVPTAAPALRAVLRAFDPKITDSRLVITSRHQLRLEGLEAPLLDLPLGPLAPAAQEKLDLRQRAAATSGRTERERSEGARLVEQRAELLARVPGISRGNPGLQDLIGRKLVLSNAVTVEHAAATLAEMEQWLVQGDLPADAEIRAFLENLTVDKLIGLAEEPARELLRALTLFSLPIPEVVAAKLARLTGGSLSRLRDLGLIDTQEDVVDYQQQAVRANAIAAARVRPLNNEERSVFARQTARDIFLTWGRASAESRWPISCSIMLAAIGSRAEEAEVVAGCTPLAVKAISHQDAETAAKLGLAAIRLLDEKVHRVPLSLLLTTAHATATKGDGATADNLLARGIETLAEMRAAGDAVDEEHAAYLLDLCVERHFTRGDLDEALRILREELLPILELPNWARERAIVMGRIADIQSLRGDLNEALRIRREEQLPVYERFGDVRERAVTMGSIADILVKQGDLDEALRIRKEEELPVYERLGDVRERAVAMGKIADMLYSRDDLDEALRIRKEEELPVYVRLGEIGALGRTMGKIADILARQGDPDEALRILRQESLPIFDRLGDIRARAVTMGKIASILHRRGDLDEALLISRQELLPAVERIGDLDGIAAALWQVAQLELQRDELDVALPRMAEAFRIVVRLGRADGIAAIGSILGQSLAARQDPEAREVLQLAADMFRKLGRNSEAKQLDEIIADLDDHPPMPP